MNDKSPKVRQSAAETLGELEEAQAAEPLTLALKDSNADVRLSVARVVTMTFKKRYYAPLFFISFLSYSIYLVHPLILTACTRATLVAPQLTGAQLDAILIFIGIPAIVLASYLLQKGADTLTFSLRTRRMSEYQNDPQT